MKNKIIEILKKHPTGLKARQIATLLPNADRRKANQILYDNPSEFEISKDYVWTLKQSRSSPKKVAPQKAPLPKANFSKNSNSSSDSLSARDWWEQRWKEIQRQQEQELKQKRLVQQQDPEWQREKQRLHEQQLRYESEKYRYCPTPKPSSEPVRACVGDCSTCTKDECIMDKIRK